MNKRAAITIVLAACFYVVNVFAGDKDKLSFNGRWIIDNEKSDPFQESFTTRALDVTGNISLLNSGRILSPENVGCNTVFIPDGIK